MNVSYKIPFKQINDSFGILRYSDGEYRTFIPCDSNNSDWVRYQEWLDAGNTPDPADPIPEPETVPSTPSIAVDAEFLRTIENAQTVTDVKMAILDAVKRQAQGG